MLRGLIEANAVENEELRFRAEERFVGKPGGGEIRLRALRHVPRVAVIGLVGQRIHGVANHHECRLREERIHKRRIRVRNQQHVGFMDRSPSANRAGIESESFLEGVFGKFVDRVADVLPDTRDVNETKIENLRVVFCCKCEYAFWVHSLSLMY